MPKKNLANFPGEPADDKLAVVLKQNQELIGELGKLTKKINQYLVFTQVMTIIKVVFIVVPLVLSIIYLPVLLKNFLAPYQSLLPAGSLDNLNSYLPK